MKGQDKNYRINFEGLRAVVRDKTLTSTARLLLVDLLLYAGTGGRSFPGQELLSNDIGVTVRQIENLANELKQKKKIGWKRGGFASSNRYTFIPEIYFQNDKTNEKSISSQSGRELPPQTGNEVPSNVVNDSNQRISSQSEILQLIESNNEDTVSDFDRRRFISLIARFDRDAIKQAIPVAAKRSGRKFNASYLEIILEDWKVNGKPSPPPKFTACKQNGCDDGFIDNPDGNTVRECECRKKFNDEWKLWKEKWGQIYEE